MTKIGYVSDVHLEFGHLDLINKDNIDILILAGDICTPHYWSMNHNASVRKIKDKQLSFFRTISDRFPEIVYIPGNHEHYQGRVDVTAEILKSELSQFSNIKVGDHLAIEYTNFAIIADTLWTDFEEEDNMSFLHCNMGMNDFQIVYKNKEGDLFRAQDAYARHKVALFNIQADLDRFVNKPVIMVSHHLPSWSAIAEGFRDDRLNGAYASNLDWMMYAYNIPYWIHGHSHPPLDMMIGTTRLLRKPRGYLHREVSPKDDAKYTYGLIEI